MKKFIPFLVIALLGLGALSASAATQTNADGSVVTVTTLGETAAAERSIDIMQDQSKLPGQDSRSGYLYYVYNVATDGGSNSTVYVGPALPDNCVVLGGYAQVITAVTPATAANSMGIAAAADLLAVGTTLNSTGLKALNQASANYIISGGTATNTVLSLKAPIAITTATNRLQFAWTGSAPTNGTIAVWLDLVQGQ
jgi:hypothetical protein